MSNWYWHVIILKTAFVLSCFVSHLLADDNIKKLPFCNPNDDTANSDLVLVSTLDGRLTAFSTQNGIKVWHVETQPLLASNLHHVELSAGGKWVRLVPSLRGTLYSLSGETIEPLPFDADQLLSSSFKYSDDLVVAGARETLWLGVDALTGGVLYECGSGGCSSEQQTAGAGRDVLVLRRHSSTVRALDPRTGNEKWNFSVAEHHVALSRRECAGAAGPGDAGGGAGPVGVGVALPEGVVAIRRAGDAQTLWQQKLDAPVAGMWRVHGGSLQHIDVLWEATQSLADGAAPSPSLYIGVHNTQLYIQESFKYTQKLESVVSVKPLPWKLITSRPLMDGGDTALTPMHDSDPNTLSLITLYGNTGQTGDHGFFLYLQETCDKSVQVTDSIDSLPNSSDDTDHHHVHVHVYSLWFWWKEVLLIAISSALLMNLMIWPRFFAPKFSPPTPLPLNQEVIVVERHYERPPSYSGAEYSGRYENDFTPLRCLGKGGFGVVFEARNNIDHCSYAVKRITLPRKESKRERVLREVRVLAKLEHEHIVRYFNAWVEEPPPLWQEQRDQVLMRELDGASGPLSDYSSTPLPIPPLRGESVMLSMPKQLLDGCVDALDFERQLAARSKRHRSLSCSDSVSILLDIPSKTSSPEHAASTPLDMATKNLTSDEDSFIVFQQSKGSGHAATKPALSGCAPPHARTKEMASGDSYIVFQESAGHSAARADGATDKRLQCVKETESIHKTDSSKGKKKKAKGHTRHWSLDMCVAPASPAAAATPAAPAPAPGTKMYMYIQMQLCRRDSLHDWLRHNRTWESRGDNVKQLFRQIVSAVEYVHLAGLIHRDLKPSNILFAPDGKVKVGDFGLVTAMSDGSQDAPPDATDGHSTHTYQVGTKLYMSPEQLVGRPYNFKVDIYSLGLILLELLHPFGTESERMGCLGGARLGEYPPHFQQKHPKEVEVLQMMLSCDPARRPSAAGVRARAPLYEHTDERWHFALPGHATNHTATTIQT